MPVSGWAWPEKHHVEVEGPAGATWALTLSETGVLCWQAITQRLQQGFQQTAFLPGPPPHTSPLTHTHTLEPYTTTYFSTVIRVIADYIHNCLTHVHQTYINPQQGFLAMISLNLRSFRMLTSYFSIRLCCLVKMVDIFIVMEDRICFTWASFNVKFTLISLLQTVDLCEIWLVRHLRQMKTHGKCFHFEVCWWISGQCVTDR